MSLTKKLSSCVAFSFCFFGVVQETAGAQGTCYAVAYHVERAGLGARSVVCHITEKHCNIAFHPSAIPPRCDCTCHGPIGR